MSIKTHSEAIKKLLYVLLQVERNYQQIGGVIGYHLTVLKLIVEKHADPESLSSKTRLLKPEDLDLTKNDKSIRHYVRKGIECLPQLAEIYPVGGAGDRLGLVDEESGIRFRLLC